MGRVIKVVKSEAFRKAQREGRQRDAMQSGAIVPRWESDNSGDLSGFDEVRLVNKWCFAAIVVICAISLFVWVLH